MFRALINLTILFSMTALLAATNAWAIDVQSTATALRLKNSITGGLMPVSDPIFANMVAKVQAGDIYGAAELAAKSPYFANYLARQLALQMQTPALETTGIADSDATTFLIAHFTGSGTTPPRMSTIWSENATYLVQSPKGQFVHASDMNANDLMNVDWNKTLRVGGQQDASGFFIPVQHVGGYTTLSAPDDDTSFAVFGATAGTNLRMIEGIWEISTGFGLIDVASTLASPIDVPRFVPIYDPNFFQGQGQPACISCHGGGFSSINHGYSTVANIFNVNGQGFVFIQNPTTNTKKSLGSDSGQRSRNLTCNLTRTPTPVCNPESSDVDSQFGWDVSATWSQTGVLKSMGWMGPVKGNGLQSLGYSIAQSWAVYQYFTERVIGELCPLGNFSAAEITRIAASANPWADPAGTDDIRTIVAGVAASSGCR